MAKIPREMEKFIRISLRYGMLKKGLINIALITLSPTAQYLDQKLCRAGVIKFGVRKFVSLR